MPLPEGMPARVLTYRWFAKVYGWTPNQVDELDLENLTWFPVIEDAAHEAQEFMARKSSQPQGPVRR